ncbi:MAG: hypothetical protein KAR40_08015 [Candidatus Sabulitectum sp.]|nr:hypothetical protein [Candidatus Sabulitectum sp.]
MRITNAMLERVVERLNIAAGTPTTPWSRKDGRSTANIGNFHISGAYGGVSLQEMSGEGGSVNDVFRCGHIPKRELFDKIHAFLDGMDYEAKR